MTDTSIILFGKKIGLPETRTTTDLPPLASAAADDGLVMMEKTTCSEEIYDHRKDESDDNPKTPSIDEDGMSENPDGDSSNLQPKTLKKPDKILPCPRCKSMNTKFCYYNNSNINQPRHFCKSCQRYWTAGGTMRNMPVGAGRRKKKSPPSHCRFVITTQDSFESSVDSPKVLSFGSNSSHFGANLSSKEKSDNCSSNSVLEKPRDNNGFHSQVHWIPYNPWNTMIPMPMIPMPMPIPAMCPPGYPPMPYWNSVSWLPQSGSILGKHPNEESKEQNGPHEESKKQKTSVLIPKTLRIDDPDEAAKSSIWATLGIKNENSLFKAFQAKGEENKKNTVATTELCPALQANPAAFSRSLLFQERA